MDEQAVARAGEFPLVDRAVLDPIMGLTGLAVMQRILAAFWNSVDDMTGALRAAIDAGDPQAIRHAAHALKGAASNVGAGRAGRLAGMIEASAPARAGDLLALLEQTLDQTRPALDAVMEDAA